MEGDELVASHKKKKKEKRNSKHLADGNVLSKISERILEGENEGCASSEHHREEQKKKKKKRKIEAENGSHDPCDKMMKLARNSDVVEDESTCDKPLLEKKKKKKKHSNSNDILIKQFDKGSYKPMEQQKDILEEKADFIEDSNHTKKKKKKKKKKNDDTDLLAQKHVSKCTGKESDSHTHNTEEGNKDTSTITENVKVKKKKKRTREDEDISLEIEDAENRNVSKKKKKKKSKAHLETEKLEEKRDKHEHVSADSGSSSSINGGKNDLTISSDTTQGQWQGDLFESEERQNKFLRLMGGMKGSSDKKKGIFSAPIFQSEDLSTPIPTGGSDFVAMSVSAAAAVNQNLEDSFNKAIRRKFGNARGSGLGFAPESNKKFHIDGSAVNSIKFDD